ncbi:MAG: DUF4136 domain-containing protein [Terracidiphilus sp.]
MGKGTERMEESQRMKLRLLLVSMACAVFSLLPATLRADSVKTDFDHKVNFANYHTYSWGAVKVSDQFNAQRIKNSINAALEKKGWKEVPSGGQITIMATDNIHSEQEAEAYYDGLGGGWGMGWGWGGWGMPGGGFGEMTTGTTHVRKAHVVIDLFDSSSKSLLWRGVSRAELSNNPNENRKHLHQDIAKMFKDFPPK